MEREPPPLVPFDQAELSDMGRSFYRDNKRVSNARIKEELGVNLRPALSDNRPGIAREDGLMRINGLFRHGYLLAPAVVCDVLAELENNHEARPFADVLNKNSEEHLCA